MYKEYLGEGYHDQVRKMLSVDEVLLTDRIIDADLNIGTMKSILQKRIGVKHSTGLINKSEENFKNLQEAGLNLLAGILCSALKSRTAVEPYKKYDRNWKKKQVKLMQKYELFIGLVEKG